MRQKFKDELDSLEHKDVLRKLEPIEVQEWLNSFVCPVKDDGSLRVCLDPTGLKSIHNKTCIQRTHTR